MKRLFASFALLLALTGCPGTAPVNAVDVPDDAPYARVVETDDALTYDVVFANMNDLTSFGLVVRVDGGTIASWERQDDALKAGGGQVLPLRANATAHELELMIGITQPVTIGSEQSVAQIVVEPQGDPADVTVTLETTGPNRGAVQQSGNAFELQNLSDAAAAVRN